MVLSGEVPGEVTDEPAPLLPPGVGADDPGHHLVVVHGEAPYSAAFILLLPVCVLQLLLIHLDRYSCASGTLTLMQAGRLGESTSGRRL
jgi:hypothetical protein